MVTIIRTLDETGSIEEKAVYTLDPFRALVAYLEQSINHNFDTWDYRRSRYKSLIKASRSGKGFIYDGGDICISAYQQ